MIRYTSLHMRNPLQSQKKNKSTNSNINRIRILNKYPPPPPLMMTKTYKELKKKKKRTQKITVIKNSKIIYHKPSCLANKSTMKYHKI